MGDLIVSNTGPLISLEKIQDGYEFIRKLYDKIIIPPKVLEEVSENYYPTPQHYLEYHNIEDLIEIRSVLSPLAISGIERLHEGEKQAISFM
jgi:predicted nucleic acid-binding protein